MKDYKAIADSVLRRRDEYLEKKKKKRAAFIKRSSIALSCCLVILAGFGIWRMELLGRITPSQDSGDYTVTEHIGITADPGGAETTSPPPSTEPPTTAAGTAGAETSAAATSAISGAVTTAPEAPVTTGSSTAASGGAQSSASASAVRTTTAGAASSVRTTTAARTTVSVESPVSPAETTRNTASTTSAAVTATTARTTTTSKQTTRTTTSTSSAAIQTSRTITASPESTPDTTSSFVEESTSSNTNSGSPAGNTTTTTRGLSETVTTTSAHSAAVKYEGFYGEGGDIYFELTGVEADPSKIGAYIEKGTIYPEDAPPVEYKSYLYGSFDGGFLRAVKYSGDDRYLIGVNTEWTPATLGELFSGMYIPGYMRFDRAYDCEFGAYLFKADREIILNLMMDNTDKATICGVSDNFLMNEYLSGNLSAPPEDDTDELLIRIEVSVPELFPDDKFYSRGYIKITRDGQLVIDMLSVKYSYIIGTEAAEAFAALIKS